jgi:hypothetical protein
MTAYGTFQRTNMANIHPVCLLQERWWRARRRCLRSRAWAAWTARPLTPGPWTARPLTPGPWTILSTFTPRYTASTGTAVCSVSMLAVFRICIHFVRMRIKSCCWSRIGNLSFFFNADLYLEKLFFHFSLVNIVLGRSSKKPTVL